MTVGANNGPYTNMGATSETGEVTPPGTGCSTQTGWCGTGYLLIRFGLVSHLLQVLSTVSTL
ncbi:MAG: hypothetical protein R2847_02015 [Bacteroidia bacterium]